MIKKCFSCQSTDSNTILHVVNFTPSDVEVTGVIQIAHGMTEHMDRYEEFGEYFTRKGYAVIGNDMIGHGLSSNTKKIEPNIYLKNWFDAVSDVKLIRQKSEELYPGKPVYLLGFSLGSFVVRSLENLNGYTAEILIGTGHQPTPVLKLLEKYLRSKYRNTMERSNDKIKKLAFDNYNIKGMPDNYWLFTDEKSRKEYEEDWLVKTDFTPGFFCEFLRGMSYSNKKMKKPNNSIIPTLFLYGENDPVAGFGKGVAKVYKAYHKNNKDTKICCIKNAAHDVLHDQPYSNIVFTEIESFLQGVKQ